MTTDPSFDRIEAAAEVLCEQLWDNAHERQRQRAREDAEDALAAADAVMFSEEALERAAAAVDPYAFGEAKDNPDYEPFRRTTRKYVRAVVAALRGGEA